MALVLFNPAALTELRRIKGISKAQLADKTNLSRPYITQLEGELRKTPSPDAMNLIAKALDVDDTRIFYLEPSIDDLLRELASARAREQVTA